MKPGAEDPFRAAISRGRIVPLPERERRFLESIERKSTAKISIDDLLNELGEPWKGAHGRMKARRYEQHALPVERWEGEGGT